MDGDELEGPCTDCARRGDLVHAASSAVVALVFVGFSIAIYRHITKPPDYERILDAMERRELLRQAAADEAPPET